MEGGHGEVPLPTYPARGFVHAAGVSLLFDHLTEYELIDDGRELAITVLRSFGLISRNANPYREDPAGPEVPVPDAQRIGAWSFSFAMMPHAGGWAEAGVLRGGREIPAPAAGGPRHGAATYPSPPARSAGLPSRARASSSAPSAAAASGLSCEWSPSTRRQPRRLVRGSFREAHAVDLLGREGASLPVEDESVLRLPLGPWEIATVRLR